MEAKAVYTIIILIHVLPDKNHLNHSSHIGCKNAIIRKFILVIQNAGHTSITLSGGFV